MAFRLKMKNIFWCLTPTVAPSLVYYPTDKFSAPNLLVLFDKPIIK